VGGGRGWWWMVGGWVLKPLLVFNFDQAEPNSTQWVLSFQRDSYFLDFEL
jgi:hypothetical protein